MASRRMLLEYNLELILPYVITPDWGTSRWFGKLGDRAKLL